MIVVRPMDQPGEGLARPGDVIACGGVGLNRKLAHLKAYLATQPTSAPVISLDGDVIADDALLRALQTAEADLAFAAPFPEEGSTEEERQAHEALTHTWHNFRVLHALDNSVVCGKAIALSPMAQEELLRLDDCIAEDLRLAERVLARGGKIVMVDVPARTLPSPGLPRFTRWFQALRAHKPLAYWSIPLLLLVPPPLKLLLAWRLGGGLRFWRGEWLLARAFLRSLRSREINWRGRRLRVERGGRILEAR